MDSLIQVLPAWLLDAPLITPWTVPLALAVTALCVLLLWRRTRRRPRAVRVAVLAVPAVVAAAAWWWVNEVWVPVADGIDAFVFVWVALALVLLTQVLVGPWRPRPLAWVLRSAVALVAGGIALALGINAHYATYESLSVMSGSNVTWTDWSAARPAPARTVVPAAGWTAPGGLPEHGTVSTVPLPASDEGFSPRDAVVYLPPAYQADPRPALPVVVLMAGVPGSTSDWAGPGRMAETLDAFAAGHGGVAPVVVSVDPLGGSLTNPLCSDGEHGNVATYVARDVPAWIAENLQVDPDRAHWTVGGISNGGTCALQTVARTPDAYGSVLVMSGERHPDLGGEEKTLDEGFGGDRAAYEANDPLTLFERAQAGEGPGAGGAYGHLAGIASVGEGDTYVGMPVPQELVDGGRAAGLDLQLRLYPGGHTWTTWSRAFADQLPWVAGRAGIG